MELQHRLPTVQEYQTVRLTTGWDMLTDEAVQQGLDASLFSVCVLKEEQLIGIGRVVGDGAIYFYIQDVIVLPEFQGQGVGKVIMKAIMNWLDQHAPQHAFIGLMAAVGVKDFYENLGFEVRPDDRPGMYRIVK